MKKLIAAALVAAPLAGCYYPGPYTYYQVPCPAGYVAPPAASGAAVTPQPPPGPAAPSEQTVTPNAPPPTATVYTGSTITTNCVAPIPNYTYGYYYPGYYGPPVYGSVFVGGRIR